MPRAGFEPATTRFTIDPEHLKEDLEDFRLFAKAKLNLSKLTASQYICKVRQFLENKTAFNDKEVQTWKKTFCAGS